MLLRSGRDLKPVLWQPQAGYQGRRNLLVGHVEDLRLVGVRTKRRFFQSVKHESCRKECSKKHRQRTVEIVLRSRLVDHRKPPGRHRFGVSANPHKILLDQFAADVMPFDAVFGQAGVETRMAK